jgi:pimeloyl-ACP methyl ester carboxylesterase
MYTLRKALIAAWALAPLILAGCGGDSSVSSEEVSDDSPFIYDPAKGAPASYDIGTHPVFNPTTNDVPLNIDFLFAGSNDGTADAGAPSNAAQAAINDLDGWSTTAYFDIAFEGGRIDENTLCPFNLSPSCLPNIFVLALNTGGDNPLKSDNIVQADPFDQANFRDRFRPVSASVESLDGGTDNVLRIRPEQPLLSKTKYLVFVTNRVKDQSGDPITGSGTYNVLGDNNPVVTGRLQSARNAVQGWEALAGGFLAENGLAKDREAARDKLAISYTFTTTDPQRPLTAMGAPRAAVTQALIEAGQSPADAATAAGNLDAGGFLPTPKERDLGVRPSTGVDLGQLTQGTVPSGVAKLYTGYIKLPYYLQAPGSQGQVAGANKPFWGQEFWRPDEDLAAQSAEFEVPVDTDGTKNVTYRYPFARQKSMESVPLQITLPVPGHDPDGGGPKPTCGTIQSNAGGYPVALYVHGITSDRTSAVALSHTLASQCIATVAIDLPVHGVSAVNQFADVLNVDRGDPDPTSGMINSWSDIYGADTPRERHFEVVQGSGGNPIPMDFSSPDSEVDTSGAWFINLGTLQNTRDNMRQAVMDLLNLNASLGKISGLDLDGDTNNDLNTGSINVVGHSLGAIIGSVYATVNQKVVKADGDAGFTPNVNPVQGAVLSAGGSQVTQVLVNSNTFRPIINAGLKANGVDPGTSNYERFLYVAQSTVASGDPVNFVETLNAFSGSPLEVPAMYQQIKDDNVVPNTASITGAPLAGTRPMAEVLGGATQVGPNPTAPSPYDFSSGGMGPGLVVIKDPDNDGAPEDPATHSSLLTPSADPAKAPDALSVTEELQAQVVQFVGSNGTGVRVGTQDSDAIVVP